MIEDAAHAHGSQWRAPDGAVRGAGALGLAGCFSFQASKSLSAGEGGSSLLTTVTSPTAAVLPQRRPGAPGRTA